MKQRKREREERKIEGEFERERATGNSRARKRMGSEEGNQEMRERFFGEGVNEVEGEESAREEETIETTRERR